MKHLYAWGLSLLLAMPALADSPTLKEARQRWLHGNYEEARSLYETLAKDAKQKIPATLGLSQTWQSQGEYDKAQAVIDAALGETANNADLYARRAELHYLRGRWHEAEQAADKAIALKPEQLLAHWVRGQIYRDRADFKKADAEFRWFVHTYSERSNRGSDITDPDELLLVGLAATEYARWHSMADQFGIILNEIYADALKRDKDFWLTEYQSGMLLLEKYNYGEALDALDKALAINPQAAEALVGKGLAALQRYEIKDAEQFAERALKINPNLVAALRLRSDIHLLAWDAKAARRDLDLARKINARDESTLGREAAWMYLSHNQHGFEALVKEVSQDDPKPGLFYYELAERLAERRQFEDAEKFFKKAAELRPMLPWPNNSLGLLYMRLGREKEAREVLTKALKADEFNVLVSNTLKVLRHLDKYETLRTEHFELRFDPQNDRRLAAYMATYLEAIYADLAAKFQHRPAGPILFEIFNNHEMFSGRVTALPDLHTVGACTGRMVAMVSPRGKDIRKPFNWARVLRHETVHVFNLDQTHFQVPHWLTEGLAVTNEGFPRPGQWNQLLRERVPAGDLMNLDNIELGFIRPRSPLDWYMAYCQSQLYVEYLKEKYGAKAVGELLNAYRDGLDTAGALTRACHVDQETFEKGYRAYLNEVVKTLQGRPAEKAMTFSQLRKAHEADPDNVNLAARLAEQCLIRRDKKEARKLAETVLAKKNTHPLASYVKARLLLDAGDEDQARTLLEAAVDPLLPEPKVLQMLGKLCYEARDFAKAAEMYELARKVEPYESKWLVELARVYAQTKDRSKLIEVLIKLVATDADDFDQRKRLAQLLLTEGRAAEAERYAHEALEIDISDAETIKVLEEALLKQNKTKEAERLQELLGTTQH